ncbi:MAG: GTP 3',8-cyclase MoaA [Chloroflexi bacterium]|nr:GTP 3',8-cyclase MoaA [Chloroflexota bacterium]
MLVDGYRRPVTYLRVSVTDRCNLRCVYCMPPEGIEWQPHAGILRYEEIYAAVRAAAGLGIRSVRLTGGEPLVRAGLPALVEMLAAIPGIQEVSLTTNGLLLEKMAPELAQAGLKRVNVSLDSLSPERFARITRGGSLDQVLRGVQAAEACGLTPVKFNVVVLRGVNLDELLDLAALSFENKRQVRFIELMPVKNQAPWGEGFPASGQAYVPAGEILRRLAPLDPQPVASTCGCGPARSYTIAGGRGVIGLISPIGDHFCGSCNRLRLTADGNLRPCLLNDQEVPLRPALRAGQPLEPLFEQAARLKPSGHQLDLRPALGGRSMRQIGG